MAATPSAAVSRAIVEQAFYLFLDGAVRWSWESPMRPWPAQHRAGRPSLAGVAMVSDLRGGAAQALGSLRFGLPRHWHARRGERPAPGRRHSDAGAFDADRLSIRASGVSASRQQGPIAACIRDDTDWDRPGRMPLVSITTATLDMLVGIYPDLRYVLTRHAASELRGHGWVYAPDRQDYSAVGGGLAPGWAGSGDYC